MIMTEQKKVWNVCGHCFKEVDQIVDIVYLEPHTKKLERISSGCLDCVEILSQYLAINSN